MDIRFKSNKTYGVVCLIVACVVFIIAGFLIYKSIVLVSSGTRTEGNVVEFVEVRKPGDSNSTYAPRVQFVTDRGHVVQFTSRASTFLTSREIGDPVTVYYFPDRPQEAEIGGFLTFGMPPFICIVLGLGFAFFARLHFKRSSALMLKGKPFYNTIDK